MELKDLENLHKGETVWVFGSGSTLNFIDPAFFNDKICVTANHVGKTFGLKAFYAYSNYHQQDIHQGFGDGLITAVMLAKDTLTQQGWAGELPNKVALSHAHSFAPPGSSWDPYKMPPPEGQIVYGSSSIHGAMHLAAHLGASHIVLVGADAGLIDNESNVQDYPVPTQQFSLSVWNRHSIVLKRWLAERYGVKIYSLNPFINLNLEGHTFQGVS
jgi:hypothetical protein